jgi:hypothetical protein
LDVHGTWCQGHLGVLIHQFITAFHCVHRIPPSVRRWQCWWP